MTPDPSGLTEIIQPAASHGPITLYGLLLAAVLYFKRISDKRETERDAQISKQGTRITDLETKQEAHAKDYRELAERMTEVVTQTKDVMQKVLVKLEK